MLMARKHSPGCYCCLGCDCGEVTPPTITISGYTASTDWQSVSECCKQIIFEPDSPIQQYCCKNLHTKTWTQTCTQKGYYPVPIFPWKSSGCPPDPDVFCRPDPPLIHIATKTTEYHEEQRLRVDFNWRNERIVVSFGRDTFTCDGVDECKWFIKIQLCYKYSVEFKGARAYSIDVTHESLSECNVVDEDCNSSETTFPINFECNQGFISEDDAEFCFERIKIFDELPEDGSFEFTNADDGTQCDDFPACARIDFETEACFVANCGSANPCWCDFTIEDVGTDEFGNPPRVFVSGGDTITSYSGACSGDCLETVHNCNNNPTVCPEVTQILPCERVNFACEGLYCTAGTVTGDYGPLPVVEFTNNILFDGGQVCPTGGAFFGSPLTLPCEFFQDLFTCYTAATCTVEDCGDCCELKDCGECSVCYQSVSAPYIWTQEIEVETTCDDVSDETICCLEYQPVTLNIVFS